MDGTYKRQKLLPATSPVTQVENKGVRLNCEDFLPCDPRRYLHRYVIFFFMCMLTFGRYYCYDNPNALKGTIIKVMDFSSSQYNSLYLVYSWPNVVISVFGGFLLDRVFGIRIGTAVFCVLICIGQLIFALGGIVNSLWVMVLGRFIFGLGSENASVAKNSYMVIWFRNTELNMAFGFLLSVSRIASTVNQNISQKLYDALQNISEDYVRLGVVFMIGFGFCVLSLLCAILLGLFDRRAERILKMENDVMEKITFRDVIKFPLELWLLIIVCVIYYVTVDPFLGLAVKFFVDKYGLSYSNANFVSSLVYFISVVACPIVGFLVDKTGFNLTWLNLGIVLTFCAHALLAFLPNYSFIPYVTMTLMGIAYSLFATVVWPLIAFIVPVYQLGTAFGIMQAVQNLGLSVFIIVAGVIVENLGYLYLEIILQIILSLALFAGVGLYVYDSTFGGKLNRSGHGRAQLHIMANEDGVSVQSTEEQSVVQLGKRAPRSYQSPLVPNSASHIRNRFLSKVGTKMPHHLTHTV